MLTKTDPTFHKFKPDTKVASAACFTLQLLVRGKTLLLNLIVLSAPRWGTLAATNARSARSVTERNKIPCPVPAVL